MKNGNIKHARCLTIDELNEELCWQETVEITQELFKDFIKISHDHALAHVDADHANKMEFPHCIVHGFLVGCGYSRILGMFLPGSNTVIQRIQLDMIAPVFIGDVLTYTVSVERIVRAVGAVQLKLSATNQHEKLVNKGTANCVFRIQ